MFQIVYQVRKVVKNPVFIKSAFESIHVVWGDNCRIDQGIFRSGIRERQPVNNGIRNIRVSEVCRASSSR